jgi:hypothetical protein
VAIFYVEHSVACGEQGTEFAASEEWKRENVREKAGRKGRAPCPGAQHSVERDQRPRSGSQRRMEEGKRQRESREEGASAVSGRAVFGRA